MRHARIATTVGLGIAGVLLLSALAAHAEVGAFRSTAGAPPSTYVLQSIVDDPDPFGHAWIRYNADAPTRFVLNDPGFANGDGPPSLLVHPPTGVALAAWARNSATGFDVVLSRLEPGGWSVPEVLAGSPGSELDPQLVLDPDTGEVHLLYWVADGNPRVLHRQAPADLSGWSAPVPVSTPAEVACRPAGAVHQGDLHVAYEVHDYGFSLTPRQIVLARRGGGVFVPEVLAISYFDGDLRPQVHARPGTLWVDWIDGAGEAAWTRRDAQGAWEPLRFEPFTGVEERDHHVRGAIRLQALE